MSADQRNRSLQRQLAGPIVALFLFLGLMTYFVLDYTIRSRLVAEFDQTLISKAMAIATLTSLEEADPEEDEPVPFVELDFSDEFMPEFEREIAPFYYQVWLPNSVLERSKSLGDNNLSRLDGELGQMQVGDEPLPDGRDGRIITYRFPPQLDDDWGEESVDRRPNYHARYPGRPYPVATITVAAGRQDLDQTLAFVRLTITSGLLALMLGISCMIPILVRRGLQPLAGMVGQLAAVDSEKLDVRVNGKALPSELAPLAETMNALLSRLQHSFEKERLFSRNIAHELRTPIAELRAAAEVGERWPDDHRMIEGFFRDIGQISSRMGLIVTNLLTMARHESGQIQCALEALDLTALVQRVGDRYHQESASEGVCIHYTGAPSVWVLADPTHLEIITSNLVSNAICHSGHASDVTVRVSSDGEMAALTMENPANGLRQSDMPYLFERFWRRDEARTGGQHAGLGLSLVRSLTSVCGWKIAAELTAAHVFRITVTGIKMHPTTGQIHTV